MTKENLRQSIGAAALPSLGLSALLHCQVSCWEWGRQASAVYFSAS